MLPLRIDDVTEPLGYGELQTLDLTDWSGDVDDRRFHDVVDAIRTMIGSPRTASVVPDIRAGRMTGSIDGITAVMRRYFADLTGLMSGPKRFLAAHQANRGTALEDGVRFLAISCLLTFVLELPLGRGNPLLGILTDASAVTTVVLLFGCAVYAAWRLAGAAAAMHQFLTIHFYLSGVLKLIQTGSYVMAYGVLKADPALYEEVRTGTASGNLLWIATSGERLFGHRIIQLFVLVIVAGFGAMLMWAIVGWGAYRQLSGLPRSRSLLAFILFCILCVPVYIVTVLLAAALV
jgi:hypothetical protein